MSLTNDADTARASAVYAVKVKDSDEDPLGPSFHYSRQPAATAAADAAAGAD